MNNVFMVLRDCLVLLFCFAFVENFTLDLENVFISRGDIPLILKAYFVLLS